MTEPTAPVDPVATPQSATGVSRRGLLGVSAGAAVAGVAVGFGGGYATRAAAAPAADPFPATTPASLDAPIDFRGEHQAGIITPGSGPDALRRARRRDQGPGAARRPAEEVDPGGRADERRRRGRPGRSVGGGPYGVPQDTGEAYGLPASALTLTIGFGPSLFDGRFGLADRRPAALQELPAFRGDDLDPARSGGDLCIQACANDPQVAVHAVRNLIRLGFGIVSVRWSQLGFGRTSSTSTSQATPRNLFGFKDGTANVKAEETAAVERLRLGRPGRRPRPAAWMAGGTYLVARRIRMHIEVWDRTNLQDQETIIGRTKAAGAPLGKEQEFDEPDFAKKGTDGEPAIAVEAHVRLAHKTNLDGVRILRRGYNFTDGTDGVGHLDAGLFFIAFVRDPGKQFVPMQQALAAKDVLNEYIEHNGSALFACPPGVAEGGYWGDALFA